MATVPKATAPALTIRLLQPGKTVEEAVRDDSDFDEVDAFEGRLFVGQSKAEPPNWHGFVASAAASPPPLKAQNCGAVLFLSVADPQGVPRTVAISFGTGHLALNPDAFERNFGLRVVLNSVARSKLRNMDVATLDATVFLRRVQASRDADLSGFGIDQNRDLLRLAAGTPRDTDFARSLAGKDALTIHKQSTLADAKDRCAKALVLHAATDYQRDFKFIDKITPVRDRATRAQLDALVYAELGSMLAGAPSDLHLALPDLISPEATWEVGYFGVGFAAGGKGTYPRVAVEDYVAELQKGDFSSISDMAALKASHEIRVIKDGRSDKKQKVKLYDCVVWETPLGASNYVLFSGEWYAVDPAFHAEVDADFATLTSGAPLMASTTATTEKELIAYIDANFPDLLNMDVTKTSPAGAAGANLEFCDFFDRGRRMIHLKDGHASAPLSHLWNQGLVSAESFLRDEGFRRSLLKNVRKRQRARSKSGFDTLLPTPARRPAPTDYTVVFGVMRHRYKKSGTLGLPFFSKVSLRSVAQRLELMGYKVEVHLIETV